MSLDLADIKILLDQRETEPFLDANGDPKVDAKRRCLVCQWVQQMPLTDYHHEKGCTAQRAKWDRGNSWLGFIQVAKGHLKSLVAEVERLRAENEEQRLELLAERGEQEGGLPEWEVDDGWWQRQTLNFGMAVVLPLPGGKDRRVWSWNIDRHFANGQAPTARKAMRAAEAWLAEQTAKVTP